MTEDIITQEQDLSPRDFLMQFAAECPVEAATVADLPVDEATKEMAEILATAKGLGVEDTLARVAAAVRNRFSLDAGECLEVTGMSEAEEAAWEIIVMEIVGH